MHPTTQLYKEAIESGAQQHIRGIMTDLSGTTYSITDKLASDIMTDSQCVESAEEFCIGGMYVSSLECTLNIEAATDELTGTEIKLDFGVEIGEDSIEWIPLGVWNITKAEKQSSGLLKITAMDNLQKLLTAESDKSAVRIMTAERIMTRVTDITGVEFAQNLDDLAQLTEHFKVSEFRCKCGGSHDTKIDSDLADKLEKLLTALNCSKIIINSGYRCSAHDKNVGGSGSGQHTTGMAADIVCYDASGKVISSKKVTCAAQDIGFGGVANIDSTYTATHVDVAARKWMGDETVTTAKSVCEDFYAHWGLTKSDVYGSSEVPKTTAPKTKNVTLTIDGATYSGTLTAK